MLNFLKKIVVQLSKLIVNILDNISTAIENIISDDE